MVHAKYCLDIASALLALYVLKGAKWARVSCYVLSVPIWMDMVFAFLGCFDISYHWLKGCIKHRSGTRARRNLRGAPDCQRGMVKRSSRSRVKPRQE